MVVTANSLTGQIDQLEAQFKAVSKSADTFKVHQVKSTALLIDALQSVFEFGEGLLTIPSPPGPSIISEFFRRKQEPYNSRTQKNVYIGLAKMAFSDASDSSRSQYSTVLNYANYEGIKPRDFKAWLTKLGGIEKCRSAALDALSSNQRKQNANVKQTRLQLAVTELSSRPSSDVVALPSGVEVPEGFAIMLVKVDGQNNASIVQVVESDSSKVDPVLVKLSSEPAPQAAVTDMDRFYRAINLILQTTPAKPSDKPRDISIFNATLRGKPVSLIEAVSEAYSFPGATMKLVGNVGTLPNLQRFILSADDAARFVGEYEQHEKWTLDEVGRLTADELAQPIQLHTLPDDHKYRVADTTMNTSKQLHTTADDLKALVSYIDFERDDNAKKNKGRAEKKPFPKMLELSIGNSRLDLRLTNSLRHAGFAATSIEEVAEDRTFGVTEVEQLAKTLAMHDVDAQGCLLNNEVDDAGLLLEAYFDDDILIVVLPTRVGADYNQVCQVLP